MPETPTVVVTDVMRRHLREQPALRSRGLWDPSNPDAGAGAALGEVGAEVRRQGLTQAGPVHICVGEPTNDGLIPGEAVIPVDRPAESTEDVEAVRLPATEAVSALYRDDIHLTAGSRVVQRLRDYAEGERLRLDGEPRWIYHTSPEWNLEPDDTSSKSSGRSADTRRLGASGLSWGDLWSRLGGVGFQAAAVGQ